MRRLGESDNFVGARWIYLDLDTRFDASRPEPEPVLAAGGRAVKSSGLGLSFEHDSRDNFFTPSSGWNAYLESMFYSPDIGSDNKYQTYRPTPFPTFHWPRNSCLGVRASRRPEYQDENAGVVEAELRWNVTPRWALIGFLGAGRAWGSSTRFQRSRHGDGLGARLPLPRCPAPRHLHGRQCRQGPRGDCPVHPGRKRVALASRTKVQFRPMRRVRKLDGNLGGAPCVC